MNSDGSNVNQPPLEFEAVIDNPDVACTTKRFLHLYKDCHLMWKHHSGKQPNKPCVFPFTYNGHKYKECLSERGEKPWCSTLVDYSGAFNGGRVPLPPSNCQVFDVCQVSKNLIIVRQTPKGQLGRLWTRMSNKNCRFRYSTTYAQRLRYRAKA